MTEDKFETLTWIHGNRDDSLVTISSGQLVRESKDPLIWRVSGDSRIFDHAHIFALAIKILGPIFLSFGSIGKSFPFDEGFVVEIRDRGRGVDNARFAVLRCLRSG